jgi:CheY-like chemotaxis protein
MRKISGDLGLVGIANLLQMFSSAEVRGSLTITSGDSLKVIGFAPEGIRLLEGVHRTNPIGEVLLRTRKITRSQLEEILVEQQASRKRIGDLLAERNILSREALNAALREQAAEEIYELFTWTEAAFEFAESQDHLANMSQNPLASVVLDANLVSIMIEAARRLDELARIREVIQDHRLTVEQVEIPLAIDDPGLDPLAVEDILPLVDGQRNVEQIIEVSLYPKFTVLRTLFILAQRGVLKIRSTDEDGRSVTVVGRPRGTSRRARDGKAHTILLVSELMTFRNAMAFLLRNSGYDVREADRWDPSSMELCRSCVSLIVLDAPIETDDGLELCRRVQQDSGLPFILLSANRSKEAAANAVRSGAICVLVKPIHENVLVRRISAVLEPPKTPS